MFSPWLYTLVFAAPAPAVEVQNSEAENPGGIKFQVKFWYKTPLVLA